MYSVAVEDGPMISSALGNFGRELNSGDALNLGSPRGCGYNPTIITSIFLRNISADPPQ